MPFLNQVTFVLLTSSVPPLTPQVMTLLTQLSKGGGLGGPVMAASVPGIVKLFTQRSWKSNEYICHPRINCRLLDMHEMFWALSLARVNAGNSIAAKMAIIAITTNNSMRVNPWRAEVCCGRVEERDRATL